MKTREEIEERIEDWKSDLIHYKHINPSHYKGYAQSVRMVMNELKWAQKHTEEQIEARLERMESVSGMELRVLLLEWVLENKKRL